jgi:membrane-bound metal-dependent hydrolase YbcI (DUF457 family)
MTWHTHAVVGANVVWLAALFPNISSNYLIVAGALGGISALLPDIDAQSAKIHYVGKGILGMFRGVFEHRGFFHSLFAIGLVGGISSILSFYLHFDWSIALACTLGYASHPVIDGLTVGGVRYLYPHVKKFRLLPKAWCTKTKGTGDITLLFLASISLAIFFWLHAQEFIFSARF